MALGRRILGALVRLRIRLLPPLTIGVRAVVVDSTGRIALVRHTYDERWYLPGGGVDAGEAIAAAIQREVREELGLANVVPERVIGLFLNLKEGRDDHVVLFLMRADGPVPDRLRTAAPFEIAEACWFAPDALPEATSPATRLRIADYLAGKDSFGTW
ncbi:NUDIX domain-containing protein [Rhizorhabdus sp. FW153]|uniref:NUDIX domain-containing protein n=1 Tax=Rhizorhabdus sp. FW153 TaxID=3400216 RepID=UPI003CE82211